MLFEYKNYFNIYLDTEAKYNPFLLNNFNFL